MTDLIRMTDNAAASIEYDETMYKWICDAI